MAQEPPFCEQEIGLLPTVIMRARGEHPNAVMIRLTRTRERGDWWYVILNQQAGEGLTFDRAAGEALGKGQRLKHKPNVTQSLRQLIRAARPKNKEGAYNLTALMVAQGRREEWKIVINDLVGMGGQQIVVGGYEGFLRAADAAVAGHHQLKLMAEDDWDLREE